MGTCYNCGEQVSLKENQTKCDRCGNLVWYVCHSCKQGFDTADEHGEKIKECKVCGYFYCPHCGICGPSCDKQKWAIEIRRIIPTATEQQVQELLSFIENIKTSNPRKSCIKNVPVTYAKGRIKGLWAKTRGFGVKNKNDSEKFVIRTNELLNLPIGTTTTVTKSREEGTYGQEYRDAFNLLVCLGKFKITWVKRKDKDGKDTDEEYSEYTRIDETPCGYLSKEELVINECIKCKKQYPLDIKFCSACTYQRTKKKGQPYPTKQRLSNLDSCQMYRGDFV